MRWPNFNMSKKQQNIFFSFHTTRDIIIVYAYCNQLIPISLFYVTTLQNMDFGSNHNVLVVMISFFNKFRTNDTQCEELVYCDNKTFTTKILY